MNALMNVAIENDRVLKHPKNHHEMVNGWHGEGD